MDEFERKLLETMANARYRDKLRRLGRGEAEAQIAGRWLLGKTMKNKCGIYHDLSWFIMIYPKHCSNEGIMFYEK